MVDIKLGCLDHLFDKVPAGAATHFTFPRLGRVRLFLPVDKKAAAVGKAFFFNGWKQVRFEAFHLAGLTFKLFQQNWVREAEWATLMKTLTGNGAAWMVILAGSPGPYAKATVLILGDGGRPLAVGKIGNTPSTVRLLENEWAWLQILSEHSGVTGSVPVPVAAQHFGETFVLLQSVVVDGGARTALVPEMVSFLSALQEATAAGECFIGSNMHKEMHGRLERLRGVLSVGWQMRAKMAIQRLERRFQNCRVKMAAAHRDFVPWNMRVRPTGVFVFDWEYASGSYLPLYDLFHFLLMPIVLKREISTRDLIEVLQQAVDASRTLPETTNVLADHQMLAYLLDLSLFYLEANVGQEQGDRVLTRYARMIDCFDTWRLK